MTYDLVSGVLDCVVDGDLRARRCSVGAKTKEATMITCDKCEKRIDRPAGTKTNAGFTCVTANIKRTGNHVPGSCGAMVVVYVKTDLCPTCLEKAQRDLAKKLKILYKECCE